jgi:hypothetical protein
MDRMDRDNNKDDTGADYRGYRGRWQIVTRVAHYLRKVSALIEDNMFLMGMGIGIGVDGCGNMHRFLEPNRRRIFNDENYNADAIIWRLINDPMLNLPHLDELNLVPNWADYQRFGLYLHRLDGLNLDNMRDLLVALNREVGAAREHPLIHRRLIARRDEIANRVRAIDADAAAADAREEAAAAAAAAAKARHLDRIRGFTYNDFLDVLRFDTALDTQLPEVYHGEYLTALRDAANRVLADDGIPLDPRQDLYANLGAQGLRDLHNPVRAAVLHDVGLENVRLGQEDGAAIRAHFARAANPEVERIIREEVERGIEIPRWARAVVDGATERERREEAARAAAPEEEKQ